MQQPIPFGPQMEPNADPIVGAAPLAVNAIWDGSGFRRRRGLAAYDGAPASIASTAIIGLYLTANGHLLAVDSAVPYRNIYDVTSGDALSLSRPTGTGALRGSGRPVFAETEAIVAIAGGAQQQKVVLGTVPLESSLLANAPEATHVVANNSRLVSNDLETRNRVRYSDQAAGSSYAGHEVWDDYVPSDARADYVTALGDNANEVFAFGRKTTQAFSADAVLTYASVTARDYGCSAPYSVIRLEDGFAWLDHARRIVVSDGRSFVPISGPIQNELDAMGDSTDTYAYRPHDGFLAWRFGDGRTFVYDTERKSWSLSMGWDTTSNNFTAWTVTSALQRDDTGATIVGTSAGTILEIAEANLTDAGTQIVMDLRTGYINHGTDARKWCKRVVLNFRGSRATAGCHALLSYRDDGGAFGAEMVLDLTGAPGDHTLRVERQALGCYRTRQWRLRYSGPDSVVFAGAVEDFDVGEV